MTHRLSLVAGLILLLSRPCAAQSTPTPEKKNKNSGVFNITQIGYNQGIGNTRYRDNAEFRNRGYVNRLRTTFGYFVNPNVSLGLGFGLDGYHSPGYNTAPLVADARYYWRPAGNSPFVALNAGYSLKLDYPFEEGMMGSANAGYRFIWGRRTHILLSAGLDLHQIKDARVIIFTSPTSAERFQADIWLKSLSFNAGFLF